MGIAFADQYAPILQLLAIAFFLLSLNTGSYFFLLAVGKIRFTTAVSIASSAIALLISIPLIRARGIEGAALGRIAYAIVSGVLMTGQMTLILTRKR
jgi:O-antigen/teichoic acid export membrane protein